MRSEQKRFYQYLNLAELFPLSIQINVKLRLPPAMIYINK